MQYSLWKMHSALKNNIYLKRKSVIIPYKNFIPGILKVLYREGYIDGYKLKPSNEPSEIEILLRYFNGRSVISKILFPSKPGKRIYLKVISLWKLNTSMKIHILSTSKGYMSDRQCREANMGGELVCIVE